MARDVEMQLRATVAKDVSSGAVAHKTSNNWEEFYWQTEERPR